MCVCVWDITLLKLVFLIDLVREHRLYNKHLKMVV